MTTDIQNELAADVEAAQRATFSPEESKLPEVQSFFEIRGLHNRGKMGDCALRTAHKNAVRAAHSHELEPRPGRGMRPHTEIPIPRGFRVEVRESISGKETVYRVTSRLGAIGDDISLARAVEQCRFWHNKYLRDNRNERRRKNS